MRLTNNQTHVTNAAGALLAGAAAASLSGMNIGPAIRHYRRARGMNQLALATAAGLSQSDISRIERGQQALDTERLEALATALDVRPSDIIARAEPGDPQRARWLALYAVMSEEERHAALMILEPRGTYRA